MLVTVRELAAYMDRTLTNRQETAAELVLSGVQSEVETFLRRSVEPQEYTETYTIPDDYRYLGTAAFFYDKTMDVTNTMAGTLQEPYSLHLRWSPVTAIDEVIHYPFSNDLSPRTLVSGQHYIPRRWGIDIWGVWASDRIEITYTAGLDGSNGHIKQVILRAAAREMQNMTDDVVGLKDFQNRAATIADIGLTDKEQRDLRRWKRRQI